MTFTCWSAPRRMPTRFRPSLVIKATSSIGPQTKVRISQGKVNKGRGKAKSKREERGTTFNHFFIIIISSWSELMRLIITK